MLSTGFFIISALTLVASSQTTTTDLAFSSPTPLATLSPRQFIPIFSTLNLITYTTWTVTDTIPVVSSPTPLATLSPRQFIPIYSTWTSTWTVTPTIPLVHESSDVNTPVFTRTKQYPYPSCFRAVTSAIPDSLVDDPAQFRSYLNWAGGDGVRPSWASAVTMPTKCSSYFSGVAHKGPAPTHGPQVKVVGAALAVGAAGLTML